MVSSLGRHVAIPTLQSVVDDATGQLPTLARALVDTLHDEFQRRPQLMPLQDAWRRQRPSFTEDFKSEMLPLMRAAREGRDPLQAAAPALNIADEIGSGFLSLVDEQQAMQDVALAQVVKSVEASCGDALHQLNAFFAALRGPGRARASDNPLRPAVFAQGLLRTLSRSSVAPAGRNLMIEAAAQPMAQGLARLYAALCQQLKDADISPLLVQAGAANHTRDRLSQGRRLDERSTDPFGDLHAGEKRRERETGEPDLLARLYRQILADPRLPPPIKSLLSRLQTPIALLARHDPALLTDQRHPAWQLLNGLTASGIDYELDGEAKLHNFVKSMASALQPLINSPMPSLAHFMAALQQLDRYISEAARQRDARGAAALAALEREEQRGPWLAVVRYQLETQTDQAPLGEKLRGFLRQHWAEVIVQAMVLHGREAPESQAWVDVVDTLFESLEPIASDAEGRALRARLPKLIDSLRGGAAFIALPAKALDPVLNELMEQHGRVLRGLPALADSPRPAWPDTSAEPVLPHPQSGTSKPPPETDPGLRLRRLIEETPSQMPTVWAEAAVDRAALPTVPVQLYDSDDSPQARAAIRAWIDAQRGGTWYHLFVQGNWLTAQLTWVAESRSFFHFVGQDSAERHSLTRGALERLLPAGLIAVLGTDCIVERAVDSLMQNLPDAKA